MKIMKQVSIYVLAFFVLGVFLPAQEMSKEDMEMMKKYQEMGSPGANHKYLEKFAGEWTTVGKMWMKPGDPPIEMNGDSSAEMVLGGRFLKSGYNGNMMGQMFNGINFIGYDNFRKEFVSMWMDSTSTAMYMSNGTLDESGKVRTDTGLWDDPAVGGKMKVRQVTKVISDDEFAFEMYMTMPDGKEFKSMEMIYSRKKK